MTTTTTTGVVMIGDFTIGIGSPLWDSRECKPKALLADKPMSIMGQQRLTRHCLQKYIRG